MTSIPIPKKRFLAVMRAAVLEARAGKHPSVSALKTKIYHCTSQQRVIKVLMCLFGHEIDGVTPGQVAQMAGISAANATRDLWNLEEAGLVERLPSGDKVRISPALGRKALAILHTLDRARRQLDDITNRFTQTA